MGLLNPRNLWLGLSLAALVAIYLRSRSRPTIAVSSLMLFEAAEAAVRRSRLIRLDALFWIEAAALSALTLAAAGLYARTLLPAGPAHTHALVFDLGASMDANDGSRIAQAQRAALAIVKRGPVSDRFSVVTYALDAQIASANSADKARTRRAIDSLRPLAVTTRRAALHAALIYAEGADTIDLFTDHPPPAELLTDARRRAQLEIHSIGAPADNLALVALDPGIPKETEGRCLIRNFSFKPQSSDLRIEVGGHEVFHSPLIVEPRAELAVRFGPLTQGGVVQAQLTAHDGLAADNQRYALAPSTATRRALVISPDANVRDDLARILLALKPAYRVVAIDNSPAALKEQARQQFDLIIAHDTGAIALHAPAELFVFPSIGGRDSLIPVIGTSAAAELQTTGGVALSTPLLLGHARRIAMPGWMTPLAKGADATTLTPLAPAAIGRRADGVIAYLAFDVRNHFLLDPDHLEALLLTINTIRRVAEPPDVAVTATGDAVSFSTFGPATLIAPDGARSALHPDQWGRVRVQPLEAGRYQIVAGGRRVINLYANYYDEAESDLTTATSPPSAAHAQSAPAAGRAAQVAIAPQAPLLMGLVLLLLLAESVLTLRRSRYWGTADV